MPEALIKRESLPDQIAKILRKEIFTEIYKPGDNLPPERELALRFGTSRVTIRKALGGLEQEGWIEIVQGRGNTVADFRTTVGLDILPSLMLACPEKFINPDIFSTIASYSFWMFRDILLSASAKAVPDDERLLLELLSRQVEGIGLAEFWKNEEAYYAELLRIGGNIVLRMGYVTYIKMVRNLLEMGAMNEPPYPHDLYHEINRSLIAAVCSGDQSRVMELMDFYRKDMEDAFRRVLEKMPG